MTFQSEKATALGYEDGLAEVLARVITIERGAVDPDLDSCNYFVHGYEVLAKALGVAAEELCNKLFAFGPGEVRSHLAVAINRVRQEKNQKPLTPLQRSQIQGVMDEIFASDNSRETPSLYTRALNYWKCKKVLL